jgi:hypothetical protein
LSVNDKIKILSILSILLTIFFVSDIVLFTLDIRILKSSTRIIIGMLSLYSGELLLSSLTIILLRKKNFAFLTQTLYFLLLVTLLGGMYDIMRLYSVSRTVTYVIEFILIIIFLFLIRKLKNGIE